jgi:hypothetical protein
MNTPFDRILVSSSIPLGECIEFENAPKSRLDYIKRWSPKGIDSRDLVRAFKRDITIDSLVERIANVNVYYIESVHGRGDELYYFSCNNHFFHGEKIWSCYHPFFPALKSISPSAEVVDSSWFVGSRNNYTHQLIDFLPNLIYRAKNATYLDPSVPNIFGQTNSILESVGEVPFIKRGLNAPRLFLRDLGEPVNVGSWRVRCIRFHDLMLVRHLSVFKAFSLVQSAFNTVSVHNDSKYTRTRTSTLYLSRVDSRVLNQNEIEAYLSKRYGVKIISDITRLGYAEKSKELVMHDRIISPPGSDNINALCFSSPQSLLVQMIPVMTSDLLDSPFTSHACLRYLLPFLHRTVLLPSRHAEQITGANSWAWDLSAFENILKNNQYFCPDIHP